MKTLKEIQEQLDESVNKLLGEHRGRVDIVGVEDGPDGRIAHMIMSGGCQGCAGAKATMRTVVLNKLIDIDPSFVSVIDDTDHKDRTNAFFKQ